MRTFFLILLLSSGLVLPAQSQAPPGIDDHLCKLFEAEQHRHPGHHATRGLDFMENYDLRYQRLVWHIDPAERYLAGAITSHFVPTEASVAQIFFELRRELTVDSVIYRGQRIPFIHNRNHFVGIYFPEPLVQGQLDSLTVWYQGAPRSGIRAFVQDEHNGTPIVWTLSQPYGAMEWWPCKQTLDDKVDAIDVLVTVPAGYRAASNGLLVNTIDQDSLITYHWAHRHPIPAYLIAVGVTNYVPFADYWVNGEGDSLEILNYVYPEDTSWTMVDSKQILPMFDLFDSLLIEYPFADERYGHAQFGWGGGMEHQTMSFMVNFDFPLLAHELAHQWFGDYVTCGSWSDIWLNEGFATWLTGITYEHLLAEESWEGWKRNLRDRIIAEPGGSVYVYGEDTLDVSRTFDGRLTYRKGAFVMHMLRWVLGDEVLWQGLNQYLVDQAEAGGYARTPDLRRHLEDASGRDLEEFFDDWIYGEGHPQYFLDVDQTTDSVFIQVFQTTSDSSVAFFEMPLPILLRRPSGDTLLRLDHRENGQTFAIPFSEPLLGVVWDPDTWMLAELVNTVSVHTPTTPAALTLSPMPVQAQLRVSWAAESWTAEQLELLDATGRLLKQMDAPRTGEVIVEMSHLPAGWYLLRLTGKQEQVVQKVWKADR
jgi:aminopeptidase N